MNSCNSLGIDHALDLVMKHFIFCLLILSLGQAMAQDDCRTDKLKSEVINLLGPIENFRSPPTPATNQSFKLTEFEQALLDEVNLARTNPREYAALLREHLASFTSDKNFKQDGRLYATHEGKRAVEEAISFLEIQGPVPGLKLSDGLSMASRDHAMGMGPLGKTGHYGVNGDDPFKRIRKYGSYSGEFAENISYSPQSARGHVIALIVDDGVTSRGHRKNIFNPSLKVTGVGCGSHTKFTNMCVMEFAGKFTEKKGGAILVEEF